MNCGFRPVIFSIILVAQCSAFNSGKQGQRCVKNLPRNFGFRKLGKLSDASVPREHGNDIRVCPEPCPFVERIIEDDKIEVFCCKLGSRLS